MKYIYEDDDIKLTNKCNACGQKGDIIIRLIETKYGLLKTCNRMNICRNPECFREIKTLPEEWIIDTKSAYEKATYKYYRDKLRGQRKSQRSSGTPFIKAQNDRQAVLDAKSTGLQALEVARTKRVYKTNPENTPRIGSIHKKYRNVWAATDDVQTVNGSNGVTDSLEE